MLRVQFIATRLGGFWKVQTQHGVGFSRDFKTALELAGFWGLAPAI